MNDEDDEMKVVTTVERGGRRDVAAGATWVWHPALDLTLRWLRVTGAVAGNPLANRLFLAWCSLHWTHC